MNTRKYPKRLNGKVNIVGNNIKNLRQQIGISRQTLSDKLIFFDVDINSQAIFDIETGTRTVIDYELCAIAKILNTTSDNLMKDFKEYLDKN